MTRPRLDPVELIRSRFPDLEFQAIEIVEQGWDSIVLDLDGAWIVRIPRRPEVSQWIEREARLLRELDPWLPVAVPVFEVSSRNGVVCVAYRKLPGSPASDGVGRRAGRDLGRFLTALHRFPVDRACLLGVPSFTRAQWRDAYARRCQEFARRVLPLLNSHERRRAERLLAAVKTFEFVPVLVHGDLGPEHILCDARRVRGIIDWTDARVGDAAIDLAWCLNGSPSSFAGAVAETYVVDDEMAQRALWYHRLGPWYEVTHGLDTGVEHFVASGLSGVRARLPEL